VPEETSSHTALAGNVLALLADEEERAMLTEMMEGEGVVFAPTDVAGLCAGLEDGNLTAAVISAERLSGRDLEQLRGSAGNQPPWSDAPLLLLADRAWVERTPAILDFGQVRIVERPLHRLVLLRAIRSAVRSRYMQRRGERFSRSVRAAQDHYRRLTASLEANVAEQIGDLKALSARLAVEVEERKHTEEKLRESEDLYRFTVDLSQQIVWTAEADGSRMQANPRFYHVTGLREGMPLQEAFSIVLHPDDYGRLLADWRERLGNPRPAVHEFKMRVADGSYRTFEGRTNPRLDETGAVIRWYGIIVDVTEQREATLALRQAEERYRLAARATNDAIWDWNIPTDQVAWSDAAVSYLGDLPLASSDIHWWEQAIHPDDRQRVVRSLLGAVQGDKTRWSAAYRLRKVDGSYAYVYDRGFIIRDSEGKAVRAVGAVVDLTERRRAEAELRRTQAELIHVSRVSAMGAMASTLAHELNQPLTAVTSYVRGSRRLLSRMEDPAILRVCEALEFAEAGALRAGQIVRRLRELVARGTVAVGPEDLYRLVEDASVLAFVDEHLHGVSHRIDIDPGARWVEADRIQIQQVLINLIRNAVQAMQNCERREVVIGARPHGEDMIEVRVVDTGTGIPDSVRDALFSPFHSTKAEGLGIGLSISRTIVEAHHGRIWAEDASGGGAIFRFTLPRADVPPDDGLSDSGEGEGVVHPV